MNDNFDLKKAYHAKQAAYDEMSNAREKVTNLSQTLSEAYSETEKLQAEYDESKAKQDKAWRDYNISQLNLKDQIAAKIEAVKECNALEDKFVLMSRDPDENPGKAEVYADAVKYFYGVAMQKMVERDNLITVKRNVPRPDNHESEQILAKLKLARAAHAEILEEYHSAKNELSVKKRNFKRLNEKYNNLRNGESANNYTNRPEKLDFDESLFVKAGIPEEYWENSSIRKRVDGKIDIYYGGGDASIHGHVIMRGDEVEYARPPRAIASIANF